MTTEDGELQPGRAAFRALFYVLTFIYPVMWLTGAGGLYWLLLVVGAAWYLVRARLTGLVWGVLAIPAVLVISAPIGLLATTSGVGRLVGLAANVAVWVSTAAVIQLVQTGDESRPLSRALALLGLSQGAITLAAAVAYPSALPVPLLRGLAPRMPGGIGAFMENNLYFGSWLDGEEFRSAGIMGQPTWAGAVAVLALLASLYLLFAVRERGWWRWIAVAAVPLSLFSVNLSLSRAASLGLIIAVAAGLLVGVRRVSGPVFLALLFAVATGVGVVLLTQMPLLAEWVGSVNSQREGSFVARNDIYAMTWNLIAQHPFPLLGYGIKPEGSELVAPIATHSAYLGMLFRGGVLGLLLLVGVYGAMLKHCLAARSIWGTTAAVLIAVWSVFEDMDPGHLVPLGLGLVMAWVGASKPPAVPAAEIRLQNPAMLG